MTADMTLTIEHDGVQYSGEIMTIKSTAFGWEDHGILTVMLHCEGSGSGTGVGGYCLDEPPARLPDGSSDFKGSRRGTAYGLDHVMRIMETVGVDRWEKLPGERIIVLYPESGHWGQVAKGIANLISGKALIFADHATEWHDAEVSA